MTKITSYTSATIKKLERSRVEITASVAAEIWGAYRPKALKYINESLTIDGFRKGMVPENILVAKVGEMAVLQEMAELALSKSYVDILINEKIDAIGRPEIHITKIAQGNPLEFIAITSVIPEIILPDYKKIADEQIQKRNLDDEKMTEKDSNMTAEQKRDESRQKTRVRIADAIAEDSKIELPDVMVESELERTQAQFSADIERMGVKLDDYLKHAKKTMEEIRKEWRPYAEKKAKLQLILNEIAKKENIKPDQKEIEQEVNHIVEHYKDADRERAAVYAETVLTNEKVFQFLEKVE